MIRRTFIKNLCLFLTPSVVSLLVLGFLAIGGGQAYIKEEIDKNNALVLNQAQQSIELLISDLDALSLSFDRNARMLAQVKRILQNESLSSEDVSRLAYIRGYIEAPANAKPFIHSIYVYYNNLSGRFLSTQEGLSTINHFEDIEWFDDLKQSNGPLWMKVRGIKRYAFEEKKQVLTIYKQLFSSGASKSDGCIVLNLHLSYLENLLEALALYPDQGILVFDKDGTMLISNAAGYGFSETERQQIYASLNPENEEATQVGTFIVSQHVSQRYGWQYASVVPIQTVYRAPNSLRFVMFILLIVLIFCAVVWTYLLTKKNYCKLNDIIHLIQTASSDDILPALPNGRNDEYGYIAHSILQTFIEQRFLKVQLSERKYHLRAMELTALQSQINHHFLFNTLETINMQIMSISGRPNEANSMIEYLSDILKYSLENECTFVTMAEEIQNARTYIKIMKVRYRDKFDVQWTYEDEINNEQTIKLLLQPLIENSIYHGIKEKKGKGDIHIHIERQMDIIRVTIKDNGIGMTAERLAEIQEQLDDNTQEGIDHIGLISTHRRIQLTYGNDCGLYIQSKPGIGTTVSLILQSKNV